MLKSETNQFTKVKFKLKENTMATPGIDNASMNNLIAANSPDQASSGQKKTWYEAMAAALGSSLDAQASKIESLSQAAVGNDTPSSLLAVTTASQKFSFMATSASTAVNSAGEGNKTLARKE